MEVGFAIVSFFVGIWYSFLQVIKRVPDKLLVITYLHQVRFLPQSNELNVKESCLKIFCDKICSIFLSLQLRSALGKEETRILYEQSKVRISPKLPKKLTGMEDKLNIATKNDNFSQLEATLPSGVKKSFSDGNIRLFSRLPFIPCSCRQKSLKHKL